LAHFYLQSNYATQYTIYGLPHPTNDELCVLAQLEWCTLSQYVHNRIDTPNAQRCKYIMLFDYVLYEWEWSLVKTPLHTLRTLWIFRDKFTWMYNEWTIRWNLSRVPHERCDTARCTNLFQTNARRFKREEKDIYKICITEMTIECHFYRPVVWSYMILYGATNRKWLHVWSI
jgi:hypothetical protein